jgi:hypothetical protein
MKLLLFSIVVLLLITSVMADNVTNETTVIPTEVPLVFSFQGGHAFGEKPVEIDSSAGSIPFVGNTSSRNIELPPDFDYLLRVEPAGISDAANVPDAGFVDVRKWVENNPLATGIGAVLIAVIILKFRRRS